MDFGQAWTALAIGERVNVSDGRAEPSNGGGLPWRRWRSHNFEGTLEAKIDGPYREMRFALDPTPTSQVSYTISEGVDHVFTPAGS